MYRPWHVDLHQLDGGRFQSDLLQMGSENLVVTRTRFNRRLDHWGALPSKRYTFVFLAETEQSVIWGGQEINSDYVVLVPPDGDIDFVTPPGCDIFAISVSEKHLAEMSPTPGLLEQSERIGEQGPVVSSHDSAKGLRESQSSGPTGAGWSPTKPYPNHEVYFPEPRS